MNFRRSPHKWISIHSRTDAVCVIKYLKIQNNGHLIKSNFSRTSVFFFSTTLLQTFPDWPRFRYPVTRREDSHYSLASGIASAQSVMLETPWTKKISSINKKLPTKEICCKAKTNQKALHSFRRLKGVVPTPKKASTDLSFSNVMNFSLTSFKNTFHYYWVFTGVF